MLSVEHTIRSYHFLSIFDRSRPVLILKEGKAAAAASIASCVSAASNSGAVPISFPDEGSIEKEYQFECLQPHEVSIPVTSKVFPDFAFTHSPLTYATFVFNKDGSLSFGTLWDMLEAGRVYREGRLKG